MQYTVTLMAVKWQFFKRKNSKSWCFSYFFGYLLQPPQWYSGYFTTICMLGNSHGCWLHKHDTQNAVNTNQGYVLQELLIWFGFLFNVLVIDFSVMLGWSHRFLDIYQYFGEFKVSCSRIQNGGRGVRTLDLSLQSSTLYHWATLAPKFFEILITL